MQYSEEGDDSYYDSYYEVNTKHTYQCLLSTIVHPDLFGLSCGSGSRSGFRKAEKTAVKIVYI